MLDYYELVIKWLSIYILIKINIIYRFNRRNIIWHLVGLLGIFYKGYLLCTISQKVKNNIE